MNVLLPDLQPSMQRVRHVRVAGGRGADFLPMLLKHSPVARVRVGAISAQQFCARNVRVGSILLKKSEVALGLFH